MYRIVKRIVRTVTTVTWLVRWENRTAGQGPRDEEIILPPSYSLTEEEVSDRIHFPEEVCQILDPGQNDEGEGS